MTASSAFGALSWRIRREAHTIEQLRRQGRTVVPLPWWVNCQMAARIASGGPWERYFGPGCGGKTRPVGGVLAGFPYQAIVDPKMDPNPISGTIWMRKRSTMNCIKTL
jgi:hypothetical protein